MCELDFFWTLNYPSLIPRVSLDSLVTRLKIVSVVYRLTSTLAALVGRRMCFSSSLMEVGGKFSISKINN